MPIVTLTENGKTTYYAVNDADESHRDGLAHDIEHYRVAESNSREYAEHALRREYLKRLTEHAYDCAQLAHLVANPQDDEEPTLKLTERLAERIAKSAIWLRSFEPFTALTAEVVEPEGEDKYGTGLLLNNELASGFYDDRTWDASKHALMNLDPWRRDHFARIEREKTEKQEAAKLTPAGAKRVDKARKALYAAYDYAEKLKKRSTKTIANKTVRRSKRRAA